MEGGGGWDYSLFLGRDVKNSVSIFGESAIDSKVSSLRVDTVPVTLKCIIIVKSYVE